MTNLITQHETATGEIAEVYFEMQDAKAGMEDARTENRRDIFESEKDRFLTAVQQHKELLAEIENTESEICDHLGEDFIPDWDYQKHNTADYRMP